MDDVFARLDVVEVGDARAAVQRGVRADVRFPAGEDTVGFRHDCESCDLESARKVIYRGDERSSQPRGDEMLVKTFARGVEQLGMVRLVRAEFRKAGEGCRLEIVCRDSAWRRVAGIACQAEIVWADDAREGGELIPCAPGSIVNTSGCGDAFVAAAADAFLSGLGTFDAARRALAASAICAGDSSAVSPVLSNEAIDLKLKCACADR